MDAKKIDKTVRSVKKKIYIISAIYVVLSVALIMFTKGIWFALAEILLMLAMITALFKVYRLDYLLNDLCDPILYYYTVIGLTKREPHILIKQKVAEHTGDYTSAIEFAFSRIDLCKKDFQRLAVYLDILRISFDAGDFALAKNTIENINSLKLNHKIFDKYKDFLGFYSCYIDGDYKKSKEHLDNLILSLKKGKYHNIIRYKMTYYEGLLNYSLGDYESAKKCFEIVANGCPKLNIAAICRRYLTGTEGEIVKPDLSISAEKGKNAPIQKQKFEWWRIAVLIIALIVLILSGSAVSNIEDEDNQHNSALTEVSITACHRDTDL